MRDCCGRTARGERDVPHKEAMCARCATRVTPLAERVGAVNTFWVDDDGRSSGDNTDVGGFTTAVRQRCSARRRGT